MELVIALVLFVGMIAIWTMMPNTETVAATTEVEIAPVYLAEAQA